LGGLGAILRDRDLLAVTFSYFCYGYKAYIFFSWFFIYLNSARGLNLKQSSYYTVLPFLAMAVASPLGGWISGRMVRRFGKRAGRCYFAAAAIGFSAAFLALGTQAATHNWRAWCWRAAQARCTFRRAASGRCVRISARLPPGQFQA
jgi:MFS transporter, ACS family, glucarate transporter